MKDMILLHDDDTWFVYLGEDVSKAASITADGRKMEPVEDRGKYGSQVRWWAVKGDRPVSVVAEWAPRERTTHWVLKRGVAEAIGESGRPDIVESRDWDDEIFSRIYDPATVVEQRDDTVIDLPDVTVLEGEPPPDDGLTWVADLPYALKHRPEYAHLFPGVLTGFRDALRAELAAEFGEFGFTSAGVWSRRGSDPVKVTRQVRFDPPVFVPRTLKSGRKSTRDKVEKFARREWSFSPPDRIEGSNRVEATNEWHRLIGEFVSEVRDGVEVPCGHCAGSGVAGEV